MASDVKQFMDETEDEIKKSVQDLLYSLRVVSPDKLEHYQGIIQGYEAAIYTMKKLFARHNTRFMNDEDNDGEWSEIDND